MIKTNSKEEIRMAKILFGEEVEDELDKLDLSPKTRNCLVKAGITMVVELFELNEKALSTIPNMTKSMAKEVADKVGKYLKEKVHEVFNNASITYEDDLN